MSSRKSFDFIDVEPPAGKRFSLSKGGWVKRSNRRKPIQLRPLGKGQFAMAFVSTNLRVPVVYSFLYVGRDYSKLIYAEICAETRSKHLPCMEKVEYYLAGREEMEVFSMPLYRAPLRKGDSPTAWAQAKVLQECLEESRMITAKGSQLNMPLYYDGYKIMEGALKCARKRKMPSSLLRAMRLLIDESSSYGSSWMFEFPVRNMATDNKGNLILFDVIFDWEALSKMRGARW